ncbi:MFS transporter [Actinoplanes awajinensis]|uniref:MFS transporter n=1 Tax=Actinoplanes awajinensis subsp. mycoplanecinus TaxID=135947 RepID=A0A0X3V2W3_9ACTN|nr:MFS transporter [Actinoplanes awajinensis]KUL39034.1 MFS transporter [Actinoplanes awajinensis subsp. mycoplanecinus]
MSFTSAGSRWTDVYLVAAGRGVSVCGDFLAATTLALVLQQTGHGGLAVSGLLLAAALPMALLTPLTGRLADRADSRTLLVAVGLGQAAVCAALAFVTHPAAIIALVALLAAGLAVTQPTLQALLPQMVRRDDLAKASGLVQTASQIGALVAPALAGFLVGQTGSRVPLLIDAASYLGLVVMALLIRTRRCGGATADQATEPVAFRLRSDRSLTVMAVAIAAVVAGVGAINVLDVFFIRDTLGASATVYGLVAASWMVGMVLVTPFFGRIPQRWISVRLVLAVLAGASLVVLAGSTVGAAGWLVPLWILGGVCNGALNVCMTVIVAGRVPAEAHGRAFAVITAVVQGAGLFGFLVAGPLLEHFDPRVLVAGAGAAGLLAALACWPLVRQTPHFVRSMASRP